MGTSLEVYDEEIWKVKDVTKFEVKDVATFRSERDSYGKIVHVKGFGSGVKAPGWQAEAMKRIEGLDFNTIAWDGDSPKEDCFTSLISQFLANDPLRKAVAFREKDKVKTFQDKWASYLGKFQDQIVIVSVDVAEQAEQLQLNQETEFVKAFPKNQQAFFYLGRIALKITGAKQVVAVGGGGIAGAEASASFRDDVHWTVLAVSRGKVEEYSTLLDWASEASKQAENTSNLEFVQGIDPLEREGYKGGKQKKGILNCFAWCGR